MKSFQVIQQRLNSRSKAGFHQKRLRNNAGFSLIEMVVATALMVILGTMVFGLFDKHAKVYKLQQEVTEVNLSLRSSLDLISADLLNAGSNLSAGGAAAFPFPVIVTKNANGNFDSITIYQGYPPNDPSYLPPMTLSNMGGVNNGGQTANSSTLFLDPAPNFTSIQTAARLPSGSFLAIVNVNPNDPNFGNIAPFTLTQDSSVDAGGVRIKLNHNPTGGNDGLSGLQVVPSNKLGIAFPPGSMVVKLAPPISYSVLTTNPARPELVRSTITSLSTSTLKLASNVVGFSQRARLANERVYDDPANYMGTDSNGNPVAAPNDYSLIRSLEVAVSCRTDSDRIDAYTSAIDSTKTFRLSSLTTKISLRNKVNY